VSHTNLIPLHLGVGKAASESILPACFFTPMFFIALWGFVFFTLQAVSVNNSVTIFNEDLVINWSLYILLLMIAFSKNEFLSTLYYVGIWSRYYKLRLILYIIKLLVHTADSTKTYISPSKHDVIVIIKNNLLRLPLFTVLVIKPFILYSYHHLNFLRTGVKKSRSTFTYRSRYMKLNYVGKKSS